MELTLYVNHIFCSGFLKGDNAIKDVILKMTFLEPQSTLFRNSPECIQWWQCQRWQRWTNIKLSRNVFCCSLLPVLKAPWGKSRPLGEMDHWRRHEWSSGLLLFLQGTYHFQKAQDQLAVFPDNVISSAAKLHKVLKMLCIFSTLSNKILHLWSKNERGSVPINKKTIVVTRRRRGFRTIEGSYHNVFSVNCFF